MRVEPETLRKNTLSDLKSIPPDQLIQYLSMIPTKYNIFQKNITNIIYITTRKAKLRRKISDVKNKIPHKFLGHKI